MKEIKNFYVNLEAGKAAGLRKANSGAEIEAKTGQAPFLARDLLYGARGALCGVLAGLILAWLQWSNIFVPSLLTSFSAAGSWALAIFWSGSAGAAGALLGGIYSLVKPDNNPAGNQKHNGANEED